MFHLGEAGEQAADEAGAGGRAGCFESLRLFRVHQGFRHHVADGRLQRVAQRKRELREAAVVVLGEVDPCAYLRRIDSQSRRVFALLYTEIVKTARLGQHEGLLTHPLNAEYKPWDSSMVIPINAASPWTWSMLA